MADYKNNFSASTLDMLASQGGTSEHLESGDSAYGSAASALPSLINQSGSRYNNAQGIFDAAMSASSESTDLSTWLDNENFQQAINNKYGFQGDQVNKGVAAANIVGSAEVAEQVASRKIDNLEQQKTAYAEVADSAGNLMAGMALPAPLRSIVGLFVPKYNIGAQLANTMQGIQRVNNLQSQDALDDEMVLQKAFGQAGYNPLANEVIEPFNKWEKQYVDEQVALQKNKIDAQRNKNSALQTALGAIQAQNHMVDTLASMHHDEVSERMNVLNKANDQEERKLEYQKDQSANARNEMNARVATNDQLLKAIGLDYQMQRDPIEDRQKAEEMRLQERGQNVSRLNKLSDQEIAMLDAESRRQANEVKMAQDRTNRASQATQLMVSQNQLEGARLRAQATENYANKIGSLGAGGASGSGASGADQATAFKPTNSQMKDAGVTIGEMRATMPQANAEFGRLARAGLATPEMKSNNALMAESARAVSDSLANGDRATAVTAAEIYSNSLEKQTKLVDDAVKNNFPNEPTRKVAKQIIKGEKDALDPALTNDIANGLMKDTIYSNNPETQDNLDKINQAMNARLISLLQGNPDLAEKIGARDIYKLSSEEITNKLDQYMNNNKNKAGSEQAKAWYKNISKRLADNSIDAPSLDTEDGGKISIREKAKQESELGIMQAAASKLGAEINAQYGEGTIDNEKVLTSNAPVSNLAYQMAGKNISDNEIRQQISKLKQPDYIKNGAMQYLNSAVYNQDLATGMLHNLIGTGQIVNSLINNLSYSQEKHKEVDAQVDAAIQARASLIEQERERLTQQTLAMNEQYNPKQKTAANTKQSASGGGFDLNLFQQSLPTVGKLFDLITKGQ